MYHDTINAIAKLANFNECNSKYNLNTDETYD